MARTAGSVITVDNRAVKEYIRELKFTLEQDGESIMSHKVEHYIRGAQGQSTNGGSADRLLSRHVIIEMLCQFDDINTNTCMEAAGVKDRMGRIYAATLRCASQAIAHAIATGSLEQKQPTVKIVDNNTDEKKLARAKVLEAMRADMGIRKAHTPVRFDPETGEIYEDTKEYVYEAVKYVHR